ncbi:DNA-directed RNA polymerase subunit beta [uncultured Agrococcus sp.]|uniref:DNA-directed RNA polymerase subunit beta n=1 Tax=uncultured Agrococcus sp. TaxID=382258 RepID=UPI0025F8A829|nr:DNA-directed RNA polymerase subunit beta [uncultured Agrococcus sp.]
MSEHRRPVQFDSAWFEQFEGDVDPALRTQLAHDTATALLTRVRDGAGSDESRRVLQRIQLLAREDGIDSVAELWSQAPEHSLPGALWRIHLVSTMIAQRTDESAALFTAGVNRLETVDAAVAGVETPTGPEQMVELSDKILHGVFAGDFALALERSASFCRVVASGALETADEQDTLDDERATDLTRKARTLIEIAQDFERCAQLWRIEDLH